MHGVSHPFVEQAFQLFGYEPFIPVKEQQEPDPDFPTVVFPNPEEKGTHWLCRSPFVLKLA
jgi:phosphomannomutase